MDDIKNDAVKVEANMAATKRSNVGKKKLKEEEKPSSSSDANFDSMMNTMEKIMDIIFLVPLLCLMHNKRHISKIPNLEDLKFGKDREKIGISLTQKRDILLRRIYFIKRKHNLFS